MVLLDADIPPKTTFGFGPLGEGVVDSTISDTCFVVWSLRPPGVVTVPVPMNDWTCFVWCLAAKFKDIISSSNV